MHLLTALLIEQRPLLPGSQSRDVESGDFPEIVLLHAGGNPLPAYQLYPLDFGKGDDADGRMVCGQGRVHRAERGDNDRSEPTGSSRISARRNLAVARPFLHECIPLKGPELCQESDFSG